MTSVKNQLQEIFQKKQLPLPKYNTCQISSVPPKWSSEVLIYNGLRFKGKDHTAKIAAELSAAERALKELDINSLENIIISEIKFRLSEEKAKSICLFIDIENKPRFREEFYSLIDINFDVYIFTLQDSPLILKIPDHPRVKPILSPTNFSNSSGKRDSSDTMMILYLGNMLFTDRYSHYIIVTSDHFGQVVADCCNLLIGERKIKVQCYDCYPNLVTSLKFL